MNWGRCLDHLMTLAEFEKVCLLFELLWPLTSQQSFKKVIRAFPKVPVVG